MWRSFFIAVGICLCILGVEALVVHEVQLHRKSPAAAIESSAYDYSDPLMAPTEPALVTKRIKPPEWAPWSMMSVGVIVALYAMTLKSG